MINYRFHLYRSRSRCLRNHIYPRADPGFSNGGGGGAQKMFARRTSQARSAKSLTAEVQGRAALGYVSGALCVMLRLILRHFHTMLDIEIK